MTTNPAAATRETSNRATRRRRAPTRLRRRLRSALPRVPHRRAAIGGRNDPTAFGTRIDAGSSPTPADRSCDGASSANSWPRSPGFSTRPTTVRSTTIEGKEGAEVEPEGLRHPVRHGNFVGSGRISPFRARRASDRRRHPGVLGSGIRWLDRARDRHLPVTDHIDRAEPSLGGSDLLDQRDRDPPRRAS